MDNVVYNSPNGRFVVTFDAKNQADLFKQIAEFQEIFEIPEVSILRTRNKEGKLLEHTVKASEIRFQVRTVNNKDFFELSYNGNNKELYGYKRLFGCSEQNKGGLFPKWKPKDEHKYESAGNGWWKYKGEDKNGAEDSHAVTVDPKTLPTDEVPF